MKKCLLAAAFLFFVPLAFGYDIVLTNGKTIQGTLISEDDEKISIKDSQGITLNFKKSLVDLEKTAAANKPVEAAPAKKEPEKPSTEEKSAATPKKPARVYDQNDLYRLRSEYPMESGKGVQFEEGNPETAPKGLSGQEWQELTQGLLAGVKSAEQNYNQLLTRCQRFQGATIQTHKAVTADGKPTDLVQAKEQVCQMAEDAKGALESARQEYAAALEQAKQENVLPGYIVRE